MVKISILDPYTTDGTSVKYVFEEDNLDEKPLIFNIHVLTKGMLKSHLDDRVFDLTNYILSTYEIPHLKSILISMNNDIIWGKPIWETLTKVLNTIDFNRVNTIVRSSFISIPEEIKNEYDENITRNSFGTRDQTYIKDEYIELISLLAIMRIFSGPLGYFYSVTPLPDKTYTLKVFEKVKDLDVFKLPAYDKIVKYSTIIFNQSGLKPMDVNSKCIELTIGTNSMIPWAISMIMYGRFMLLPLTHINNDYNINYASDIYRKLNTLFKPVNTPGGKLRDKFSTVVNTADDGKESSLEIYRTPTEFTDGDIFAIRTYFNPYKSQICKHFNVDINEVERIKNIIDDKLTNNTYPVVSLILLCNVFKYRTTYNSPLVLLSLSYIIPIAYLFLKNNGFDMLADVVMSVDDTTNRAKKTTKKINLDMDRIMSDLDEIMPLVRTVGTKHKNTDNNDGTVSVILICNEMKQGRLVTLLPIKNKNIRLDIDDTVIVEFVNFLKHMEES